MAKLASNEVSNPKGIRCKAKRLVLYKKYKAAKSKVKKAKKAEHKRLVNLGKKLPLKTPRTIDSAREADATIVDPNDLEVF
jgi:hypothetical protein